MNNHHTDNLPAKIKDRLSTVTDRETLIYFDKYTDQLLQTEKDSIKKAEERSLSILSSCGIVLTIIGFFLVNKVVEINESTRWFSVAALLIAGTMIGKCIYYIGKVIHPISIFMAAPGLIDDCIPLNSEPGTLRESICMKLFLHKNYQNAAMEKQLYFNRALLCFLLLFPIIGLEILAILLSLQIQRLYINWAMRLGDKNAFILLLCGLSLISIIYGFFLNTIIERSRKLWRRREFPKNHRSNTETTTKTKWKRFASLIYSLDNG